MLDHNTFPWAKQIQKQSLFYSQSAMPFSEEREEVYVFSFSSLYEWVVLPRWAGRLHRPRLTKVLYNQYLLDALPTSVSPFSLPNMPRVLLGSMWVCRSWPHCLPVGVECAELIITFHPFVCSNHSQCQHMNRAGHTVVTGGSGQSYSLWNTCKSIWPVRHWAAILGLGTELASGWSRQGEMERTQVFWTSQRHRTTPHLKDPCLWIF